MAEITPELFAALKARPHSGLKFVVVTPSMEPVIMVGQQITVEMSRPLRRWDIIVWWDGNKLICHVLWHINQVVTLGGETTYITCPLKGSSLDLSVPATKVLGTVTNFQLTWAWRVKIWWNHRR
jgi:hypothetical protein